MIPVDLITGFLGAGKTTFLLRYAQDLLSRGLRIGILVYDHGAVNVDLPLLNPLRSERCELETLAASCDADCHRRRFCSKLIAMAMSGYDRILIEPSGVFDMDEFFDTLREEPLDRWLEIGNVICILDAKLSDDCLPEEEFFLASQAHCAGRVVLSRVQLASEEEIEQALSHTERALASIHSDAQLRERVICKAWSTWGETDFALLHSCGYSLPDYVKSIVGGGGFQSLSFLNLPLKEAALREKTTALFENPTYGRILRVKGFFSQGDAWYQLNAIQRDCRVERARESLAVITVIGRELNERAIHVLLTGEVPNLHIL